MRLRRHLATVIVAVALGVSDPAPGVAQANLAAHSATTTAPQVVRISTTGFDWGDAAIGAAAGFGLSMLALGGGLVIAGARRPGQPSGVAEREDTQQGIAGTPTLEPIARNANPNRQEGHDH